MSMKKAVHERDRNRCVNCLATEEVAEILDVDHVTPKGVGGSERIAQLVTLCRACHDAKHGHGIAPMVRAESTGTMTDIEFDWYRHLMKSMLPALARQVDVRIQPKFDVADEEAWCIPLGDVRALSDQLADADDAYLGMNAHQFM